MKAQTLTARWVFPVDGPPLAQGTITVDGPTIAAVEPGGRRRADLDLGNAAILPGLVNAHTHFDLSGMRGLCPPTPDFPAWLRGVVRHRRQVSTEQIAADIQTGLAECQRYGTTLLGDISGQGLSWPILENASLRSVVFLEVLGLSADRAEDAIQQAASWLDNRVDTAICRAGLSPHAPYSVRAELFQRVAELVRQRAVPVAIHLAETREELELLEHHRGAFVDFLKEMNVWQPEGLIASPAEVARLFQEVPQALFVHGNYLPPQLIGRASLVYCPRTHAAFGHAPHPFREALEQGVCVALGTDSLASNPDLDILAEARFIARQNFDLPGETLLRMLTLNGARALGFEDVTGSLAPGKSADMVMLPLPDGDAIDPHALLFGIDQGARRTMWRGAWI